MDTVDICSLLEETTYLVNVFYGNDPLNQGSNISIGSAVCISGGGDLLTAAHVITGRFPIREEDVLDPKATILAKRKGGQYSQYRPGKCALSINNPQLVEPITIDLGLLHPLSKQNDLAHLKINREDIRVGTQVLMAGHPDDMETPFLLDQHLDPTDPNFNITQRQLQKTRDLLMIKFGMIGHRSGFVFTDGISTVEGEIIYIDNELHSGASGGPVLNMNAEIIGILTRRAVTSVSYQESPNLRVPSGSTIAVSPRSIGHWIDEIFNETSGHAS